MSGAHEGPASVFKTAPLTLLVAPALQMTQVGTPHWCAPEVLRGERYDVSADVYSFGILLFELATRDAPYLGVHPSRLLVSVCNGSLRPTMPAGAPPLLALMAARCWAPRPADRPAFAALLAELSEPALALQVAAATAPVTRPRGHAGSAAATTAAAAGERAAGGARGSRAHAPGEEL